MAGDSILRNARESAAATSTVSPAPLSAPSPAYVPSIWATSSARSSPSLLASMPFATTGLPLPSQQPSPVRRQALALSPTALRYQQYQQSSSPFLPQQQQQQLAISAEPRLSSAAPAFIPTRLQTVTGLPQARLDFGTAPGGGGNGGAATSSNLNVGVNRQLGAENPSSSGSMSSLFGNFAPFDHPFPSPHHQHGAHSSSRLFGDAGNGGAGGPS
jgi:hypothetical protein